MFSGGSNNGAMIHQAPRLKPTAGTRANRGTIAHQRIALAGKNARRLTDAHHPAAPAPS